MKTWYQVNLPDRTVFGFSIQDDGFIKNHPQREWEGAHKDSYRKVLIEKNAVVFKIADQIEKKDQEKVC